MPVRSPQAGHEHKNTFLLSCSYSEEYGFSYKDRVYTVFCLNSSHWCFYPFMNFANPFRIPFPIGVSHRYIFWQIIPPYNYTMYNTSPWLSSVFHNQLQWIIPDSNFRRGNAPHFLHRNLVQPLAHLLMFSPSFPAVQYPFCGTVTRAAYIIPGVFV